MANSQYDVFLSYHHKDHEAVEAVARMLRERGLSVFLDRWYLVPGQSWPITLERALEACRAVAVFLGPAGMGTWQQREQHLALERQAKDETFPVIPVLLPGADPALGFLQLNMWVDLREGVNALGSLAVLEAAIEGKPPGPDAQHQVAAALASVCPYRGLRPFREEDAGFFYGRESYTERLAAAVERHSLVAVVGVSGSGKSSVVRAGLIPRLRTSAEVVWDVITMVPGERPLHSLVAALLPPSDSVDEFDHLAMVGKRAAHLADKTVQLRDVVSLVLEKQPGTDRLLLVIDQFEELYTLCKDDEARERFLEEILDASAGGALSVVLTLRGDFFGRALAHRALADRMQDAVINVGPMRRDELQRSITQPATQVHLEFQPRLVDRILDDVGEEPGNLPLLEFVLASLWEKRRGGLLHHDAYEEMGGVQGAIANRAEEVFDRLEAAQKVAARRILLQMVRPGETSDDTRMRAILPERDALAVDVVRKLADARLVVTGLDAATAHTTVEFSHEALIRHWGRLTEWIDENREFLRTRSRIEVQVAQWEEDGHSDDRLLPRGRPLAESEELLAAHADELSPPLIDYINASIAAQQAREEAKRALERQRLEERLEAEEAVNRERLEREAEKQRLESEAAHRLARRTRIAAFIMGGLAVVAGIGGFIAYDRSIEANHARALAEGEQRRAEQARAVAHSERERAEQALEDTERARVQAQTTDSFRLADAARQQTAAGNATLGILLALEALPTDLESPDRPYVPQAETALYRSLAAHREQQSFLGHADRVHSAMFSADGQLIVSASSDTTARLWDVASGAQTAVLSGHASAVAYAAFNTDGALVVSASLDNTARLWDAASGAGLTVLTGHTGAVVYAAFSADSERVVTASLDGTARLWDVASGNETAVLSGHTGAVVHALFSPDAGLVLTASDDTTVRLWDAENGDELFDLRGHTGAVVHAAFSADSRRVVSASGDATARVWSVATGKQLAVLSGHTRAVVHTEFSADSQRVVTASYDETARVWNAVNGEQLAVLRGHVGAVGRATFDADGRRVATASYDKTARLWDVATGEELAILGGHTDSVVDAAFSPDGQRVVTASDDYTLRIWRAEVDAKPFVLEGHTEAIVQATFSPNGRRVVTASKDKTARIWDERGEPVGILEGHTAGVDHAAFSPDGRRIVTASRDQTARLWDTESQKQLAVLIGHSDRVPGAAFSLDGKWVVTASLDGTARLWDANSGRQLNMLGGDLDPPVRHTQAWFIQNENQAQRVVTRSLDSAIRVWDIASGRVLQTFSDNGVIRPDSVSANEQRFVFRDEDATGVADLRTREELAVLRGHKDTVLSAAISADGLRVITTSRDRTARLWHLLPFGQKLIERARRTVRRGLSPEEREAFFLTAR